MARVEWALDCKAECGESPVCDAAGNVFFVDTFGSKIFWYSSVNGSHKTLSTPQKVGCIVPRAGGSLLAALEVGTWSKLGERASRSEGVDSAMSQVHHAVNSADRIPISVF